jgi:hypothetical protein
MLVHNIPVMISVMQNKTQIIAPIAASTAIDISAAMTGEDEALVVDVVAAVAAGPTAVAAGPTVASGPNPGPNPGPGGPGGSRRVRFAITARPAPGRLMAEAYPAKVAHDASQKMFVKASTALSHPVLC